MKPLKQQRESETELQINNNQSHQVKASKKFKHSPKKNPHQINIQNFVKQEFAADEKVDPNGISSNVLVASYSGFIQSAQLFQSADLQVSYQLYYGEQWKQESQNPTSRKGQSQFCEAKNQKITFNLPFECTLTAGTVSEWPQMILVFKGFDLFGRKITKGYAQIHLPIKSGNSVYTANIYAPETSWYQSLMSWIYGISVEYKRDFEKIIVRGEGREIGKIKSIGKIKLVFNTIFRNLQRMGYC